MSGIEPFLLGAAATAGTGGVATAATGGLLGFGGTMTLGSALSTGFTLASAASSIFGSIQQAGAINAQAEQDAYAATMAAREDMLDAKQEGIRGKQEVNAIMDNMIQTIASQNLAFAVNGVDPNFGTPTSVEKSTRKLADLQIGVTRSDAQVRALARRRSSYARTEDGLNIRSNTKDRAGQSVMGGFSSSGGTIANLVDRRISRG